MGRGTDRDHKSHHRAVLDVLLNVDIHNFDSDVGEEGVLFAC